MVANAFTFWKYSKLLYLMALGVRLQTGPLCGAPRRLEFLHRGNPFDPADHLGAWNRGKIRLIEDLAMMKLVAGDEVGQGKNRDRVVAGDAAPQPRFRVQRTK